jgi:hypothetical protein
VSAPALGASYVLPLRWTENQGVDELTGYLRRVAELMAVIVVDGSSDVLFEDHRRRWAGIADVRQPEPWPGRNGKVAGVMTGLRYAQHDRVVIADDDVRYDTDSLAEVVRALEEADVVRPQNFFLSLPWHARWDTGRSLLNRAFGSDYPGTLGVRAGVLRDRGGYSGEALFENLELIRTVVAGGGRERRLNDIFVGRLPPTARHFAGQRVRQAYDDLAQPGRLLLELCLLPLAIFAVARPRWLVAATALVVVAAESGRRKAHGEAVFPPTSALWAPLWVAERALCVWLALAARVRGGVTYRGNRVSLAAHPVRALRALQPGDLPWLIGER